MLYILWYGFLTTVLISAIVFDVVGYLAVLMMVVFLVMLAALFVDWDHLSDRGF